MLSSHVPFLTQGAAMAFEEPMYSPFVKKLNRDIANGTAA